MYVNLAFWKSIFRWEKKFLSFQAHEHKSQTKNGPVLFIF